MSLKNYYDSEYYNNIESSKPSLPMNMWSVNFRKKMLVDLFKGKKICDVGCGPGFYVDFCINNGIDCTGVDISSNAINYCKQKIKSAKFHVVNVEEEKLPIKFEGIFSFDVIEHVFNYDVFLKNIYDSLNENGITLISSPNILAPQNRIKFLFGKGAPFCDKEHIHFFTTQLLMESMMKAGFKNLKLIGTGKLAWLSNNLAGNIYVIGER